jgi:hypothetical protein
MLNPPASSLSLSSPDKLLSEVYGLIENLKDIYAKESAAMQARDIHEFLKLQPSKDLYTRDYELRVKEIKARSASMKNADPALRKKVIDAQIDMAILAENSMIFSLRMAESMKRVQHRLIDAARFALQQESTAYGASGSLDSGNKLPATALNESI